MILEVLHILMYAHLNIHTNNLRGYLQGLLGRILSLLFQSTFFIFCITLLMRISFLTGHVLFRMRFIFSWGIST
jgi:hypothetical protein